MALADRYYMRNRGSGGYWSACTVLLVLLVSVFAFQQVNYAYLHTRFDSWAALSRSGLKSGWLWQLITFQFLHGGLFHLLANTLSIWFIGRFVEMILGRRRFWYAYLGTGAVGGLLQGILMLWAPAHFGNMVVGASAGASGMFAIFAMLQGESEIRWNFIFPIKAKVLLYAYAGISLFFTIVPSGGVAHAAHLGGILAGVAWVKLGWHHDYITLPWERWMSRFGGLKRTRRQPRARTLAKTAPFKSDWASSKPVLSADLPEEEFISKEVDPILDKISEHGIQSLTERERRILEAARNKMAKR